MEKIKEYFNKIFNSETAIKRIPFYFFLICVLLIALIFKIGQTNKLLHKIAYNNKDVISFEKVEPESELETKRDFNENIPAFKEENRETFEQIYDNKDNVTETTVQTTSKKDEQNSNEKKTYVINKSSKKIHSPKCSYANKMNEENKSIVNLTDDELKKYLDNGYKLCSSCGGKK